MAAPADRRLTVTRQIAAPIEDVFDAWRDPEALAEWMTPDLAVPSHVQVDFRVGGKFSINMASSRAGALHSGRYLSIDPPHSLSFTWRSASTADRETHVSVTLRALGPERTELTLEHWGFVEDSHVPVHQRGWTQLLDQLATRAATSGGGA